MPATSDAEQIDMQLLVPEEQDPTEIEPARPHSPNDTQREAPPRQNGGCVAAGGIALLMIMVTALAATGTRSVVQWYAREVSKTTTSTAMMISRMDTSTTVCANPWQHACGGYAAYAGRGRTVSNDQAWARSQWVARAALTVQSPWTQFVATCIADRALPQGWDVAGELTTDPDPDAQSVPAQWMVQRGLEFGGVLFRREPEPTTASRPFVFSVGPPVWTTCQSSLDLSALGLSQQCAIDLRHVAAVATTGTFLVCVNTRALDVLCFGVAYSSRFRLDIVASDHQHWCTDEAERLWPGPISAAYEAAHPYTKEAGLRKDIAAVAKVFHLKATVPRLRWTGPLVSYASQPADQPFWPWWASLRESWYLHDSGRLARNASEWPLTALSSVPAYTTTPQKTVFIPRAMLAQSPYTRVIFQIVAAMATAAIPPSRMQTPAATVAIQCVQEARHVSGPEATALLPILAEGLAMAQVHVSPTGYNRAICAPNCIDATPNYESMIELIQGTCRAVPPGDPVMTERAWAASLTLMTPDLAGLLGCVSSVSATQASQCVAHFLAA